MTIKRQTGSLQRTDRWRSLALVASGAVAVHQLRYALSPVPRAVFEIRHAYLPLLAVPVALALLMAIVILAEQVLGGGQLSVNRRQPASFGCRWLRNSCLVLFTFVVQETLEAIVHPGPEGVAGIVWSRGGAIAVALTILVGALIALLEHEAEKAIRMGQARLLHDSPLGLAPRPWPRRVAAWAPRATFPTDSPGRAPPAAPVTS